MMSKLLIAILVIPTKGFTPVMPTNHHECVTSSLAPPVSRPNNHGWWNKSVETAQKTTSTLALLALAILMNSQVAFAADFAKLDISGKDFSGQDLSGKDFTGVLAKNTNFRNSNLQGSQFINANLVNADFSGADVQRASFEGSTLDGAVFKDVTAQRALFTASILDVGSLENADLTDSLWPSKLRIMICDIDELKGTNPVTGVDSRHSILCE